MGAVTEFRFSSEIGNTFRGNNALRWLVNWGEGWGFVPSYAALVFVDNHDNQRGHDPNVLTYKNPREYKMATAFAMAHTYGIPRIMSSFDFTDSDQGPPADGNGNLIPPSINPDGTCGNGWVCEHRWRQIYNMIGFRNEVRGTNVEWFWTNDNNQISFCRGDRGFIAFNNEGSDLNQMLRTCLPAGTYCDVISGENVGGSCSGSSVVVDSNSDAQIFLPANAYDGVLAIHTGPASRL